MASYEGILAGKYPAKLHAKRVVDYIKSKNFDINGVLYLESKPSKLLEDTDQEEHFRQRRYFFYLTGVELPDCQFLYDITSAKSILFIPPVDPESVIWSGLPLSAEEALDKFEVDEVKYTTDINSTLAHLGTDRKTIYAIDGQVSENVTFLGFEKKAMSGLKQAIEETRVVKSDYEIALIRKANNISSAAHKEVMETVKKCKDESQLEAVFVKKCIWEGAKNQAYSSIVASGRAAATLHYVKNDQPFKGKQNVLLDAGCEWRCYASDITRTFPISGKWSKESRDVYDVVYKMRQESLKMLKEDVLWDEVHENAHRIAIDGLLKLGILKGDKEAIFKTKTSVAFFPHGLGHYLGMDTHDTGGHANYSDEDTMFRYLRVRGKVPAGSVITVEPGIYFCSTIIEPCLVDPVMSKHIDRDVLDKYWDVGGVRIEDNILITKTGCENLTTVPSDPDEIEQIIQAS